MAKKDMKSALGASLKAEEQAVRSRFEKAESVLGREKSPPRKEQQPPLPNGGGKVIRDSFTIPEADHGLIGPLKTRCMKAGVSVNKSELLRAGLRALTAMSDRDLTKLIDSLERVKPGRPAK
jgi:hypothetical protein